MLIDFKVIFTHRTQSGEQLQCLIDLRLTHVHSASGQIGLCLVI